MDNSIYSSSKISRYSLAKYLGAGEFATVYLASDTKYTFKTVVIKKIEGGIYRSALREIKLLKELKHINIVKLLDIFCEDKIISLVFEFMTSNLENVIKNVKGLEVGHIKNMSIQLLTGLEYLHDNCVLHRDLKPTNIFVGSDGVVKIGDFELARHLVEELERPITTQVVMRWYRCPELLLSVPLYCIEVDLWSVGCIIAEMFLRVPLFAGDSDIDQLKKIFQVTGVPTKETWPDYNNICRRLWFTGCPTTPYKEIFTDVSDEGIDLLSTLLSLNPIERGTCTEALQHPYFASEPCPCQNSKLPLPTKETSLSPLKKRNKPGSEKENELEKNAGSRNL